MGVDLMEKFNFYYDESEHSRVITESTVKASNYYDNFVASIVGWTNSEEDKIQAKYQLFEEKYNSRKSDGELKSTSLKQKQLRYGFGSLSRENLEFVTDFLNLFDGKIYLYFSVTSKIEYIICQLLADYKNNLFEDMDALKYTIVKSIVTYQPEEIISGMYRNSGELIELLKKFYHDRITKNAGNVELKEQESTAFEEALALLDDVNQDVEIDWEYCIPFLGFKKYTDEKGIGDYTLFLDKEGSDEKTLQAAKRMGFCNAIEMDSKESFGIRMADIMVGLIAKFIKSIDKNLKYNSDVESLDKKLLNSEWFNLNEQKFDLYKQLKYIVIDLHKAWYKGFTGIYADDIMTFVSFLGYIDQFDSVEGFNEIKKEMHPEYFNSYSCRNLHDYFERLQSKLPIDPILPDTEEFFYNRKGAQIFFDPSKQPVLELEEGSKTYKVLSVGFLNSESTMIPAVTLAEEVNPVCYRLPEQLLDWATSCVAFANRGSNRFPAEVIFTKENENYYVDIL